MMKERIGKNFGEWFMERSKERLRKGLGIHLGTD